MTEFLSLNGRFRFNTHYKKAEPQTALNFVHWLIKKTKKKKYYEQSFFMKLV